MSRPWTMDDLAIASVLTAADISLAEIGDGLGRTAGDIDLALWALLGRAPADALKHLNDPKPPTHPLQGARDLIARDLEDIVECNSDLGEDGVPVPETLEPAARGMLDAEYLPALAALDAAIAAGAA